MNKIEKERKNDTADIADKGNLERNKNRILRPAHMNFKPTEILNTPTFNRSCNTIRVKKGFSN